MANHPNSAIVILSDVFNLTGVETAMMRILRWLQTSEFTGFLILPDATEIHESWNNDFKKKGFTLLRIKPRLQDLRESLRPIQDVLEQFDEILTISICLNSFYTALQLERILGSHKTRSFFYYLAGESGRNLSPITIVERCNHYFGMLFMDALVNNRRVIFMDEYTRVMCFREYKLRRDMSEAILARLPMEVPDFDKGLTPTRHQRKTRRIVTFTRMDFPMKGYVLGLVDAFEKLCHRIPDLELVLVGTGINIDRLYQRIALLPKAIAERVKIEPPVGYDELERFLTDAYIFVGMGTTVIDAAKRGVPTIPVYVSQEGEACVDFFHNQPVLGADVCDIMGEPLNLTTQLEMALHWTHDEYHNASKLTHKECQENYSFQQFVDVFLSVKPETTMNLKLLSFMWKLRKQMKTH